MSTKKGHWDRARDIAQKNAHTNTAEIRRICDEIDAGCETSAAMRLKAQEIIDSGYQIIRVSDNWTETTKVLAARGVI